MPAPDFPQIDVASLSKRVAEAARALMEAWTRAGGSAPVTAADVLPHDGGSFTVQATAQALTEARRHGLASYVWAIPGLWLPTEKAQAMRRSLEARVLTETSGVPS